MSNQALFDSIENGTPEVASTTAPDTPTIPIPEPKPFIPTPEQQRLGQLNLSMDTSASSDPAEAAKRVALSKQLNLPTAILPPTKEAEAQAFKNRNPITDLIKTNPELAQFMLNRDNAAMVGKNVDGLKAIENFVKDTGGNALVTGAKTAVGMVESLAGIANIFSGGGAGKALEDAGFKLKDTQQLLNSMYSPDTQKAMSDVQNAEGFMNTLGAYAYNPNVAAHHLVQSFGQMVAGGNIARALRKVAPGVAPIVAGAAGEGAVVSGSIAERVRQESKTGYITPGQTGAALGGGVASAFINILGGKLSQHLGIKDIDTLLASGKLSDALKASAVPDSLAKAILKGSISEGVVQEMPQSAVEQMAENIALGKPWDKGIPEAMASGLVVGSMMGAGTQMLPTGKKQGITKEEDAAIGSAILKTGEAFKAQTHNDVISKLSEEAAKDPLKQNAPDAFHEFVDSLPSNDGQIKEVYVAHNVLTEALKQSAVTPEELANKLPDVAKDLHTAQQINGDVRISLADYLTHIAGSKVEPAIIQHLKTSPEGFTKAEADAYFQEQKSNLTEQAKKLAEEGAQVLSKAEYLAQQSKPLTEDEFKAQNEGVLQKTTQTSSPDASTLNEKNAQNPTGETYQDYLKNFKPNTKPYEQYLKEHANKAGVFAADAQQVHDTIVSGLNSMGRFTPAANEVYAVPLREFFTVNAAREGILPSELYARMPLNFAHSGQGALHQFAGQNAETMDQFTLSKAQQLLSDGVDAETVRQDTGWFKGVDGKWRFEIDDSDAKLKRSLETLKNGGSDSNKIESVTYKKNDDGSYDLSLRHTDAKDIKDFSNIQSISPEILKEILPKNIYQSVFNNEGVDAYIGNNADDAKEINASFDFEGLNALYLKDVLDHPKLYAAYPNLRDTLVQVDPKLGVGGAYILTHDNDTIIRIGTSKQLSTLLHEIQHAIQDIEGFAKGTSPTTQQSAENVDRSLLKDAYDRRDAFENKVLGGITLGDLFVQLDNSVQDDAITQEDADKQFKEAEDKVDTAAKDNLFYANDIKTINKPIPSAFDRYHRTAGEVEARNTQARQTYDRFMRKNTPPQETADVPKSDVIVMFDGKVMENAPPLANAQLNKEDTGDVLASYHPSTFTIALLNSSNLSSVIHEGGHFYLEALADMASKPNAPQQIKDDFRRALDWFGITGDEVIHTASDVGTLNQSIKLDTTSVTQYGVSFETGKPATFAFTHNNESATSLHGKPKKKSQYGRYYEPSGRYVVQVSSPRIPDFGSFDTGHITFNNPLVINNNNLGWKEALSKHYKGLRGKELSKAIIADGYDGVVTVDYSSQGEPYTSEIIDLTTFDESKALYQGATPDMEGQLPPGSTPEEVWAKMSFEQKVPYHEQWAQSFERYTLEGKSPTIEMQPVFARMREWMLRVYTSLKEFLAKNPLAGKLNDEIRGVFDRLIASEEAIADAQRVRSYMPLFSSAQEAEITQHQYDEYLALGERATNESIDELSAKSIHDMKWLSDAKNKAIKALQAEAKSQRKEVLQDVIHEVMSEPVNQARTFMRKGEITRADGEVVKATATFKLDKAAVKELFPNQDLSALKGMLSDDGVDPDFAANMFGFDAGASLINALLTEPAANKKIAELTDQRMLEKYGEASTPEALERQAEALIHNEARARFMAHGLKILTKTKQSVSDINKAAKEAAEATIAAKKIKDIRPNQYAVAEGKANKEAIKRVAKDPKGAVEAQRAALLNNRLTKAAQQALKDVEAGLRYVKRFDSATTQKVMGFGNMQQINAILDQFDFRKSVTHQDIRDRQYIVDWINEQKENGFDPTIDVDQMLGLQGKSYKDLTIEDFRGIIDTIKQIEHVGRAVHKLMTEREKIDFKERMAKAEASINDNANRTVPAKESSSDTVSTLTKLGRQFNSWHRKMASIIREMDGGKDNGEMYRLVLRPMNEAGDFETERKRLANIAFAGLMEKLPKQGHVPGNLYTKKELIPGTDISLSQEQRVMFGMNWGNAGNKQRLLDGGLANKKRLTMTEAEAILDTLTKPEWDFIQGTLDYVATFKEEIAALERKITGVEPKWIEATPIHTKYGTYRGGYFPAKYDTELSTRSESLEAATDLRQGMKSAFGGATTRNGSTKERANKVVDRPILLSYNVITSHLSEVTHRLAWEPWLMDMKRILKALDEPIRTHYGNEILSDMRKATEDIAEGDQPARNALDTVFNHMRQGSSIVGMGWSVQTALLQPSGLFQSWERIGGKWIASGVWQYLSSPFDSASFADEQSSFMRNRAITQNREMNDVLNTMREGKNISAFKASFFWMIAKMQRMVDIPTWLGAREKALAQLNYQDAVNETQRKDIEKQASALADQAVLDSQGGGQIKDLAGVQRGTPAQKLYTNFFSYFNVTYNRNVELYRRTHFSNPMELAAFVGNFMLLNTLPVLFTVALRQMLKGGCDDGDMECMAKKFGEEQTNYLFGQMVLLREMGPAVNKAMGVGDPFGYHGPAGLRFLNDLFRAGEQTAQGELDFAAWKAYSELGAGVLHLPIAQVNRTVEGIMAIEDGKVEGVNVIGALISGKPKESK